MSEHDRVVRWLDAGSEANDELREILRSAADDEPSASELTLLDARVAPLFGPTAGAGAGPSGAPSAPPRAPSALAPSSSSSGRLLFRVGVGIGVLGALGLGFSTAHRQKPERMETGLTRAADFTPSTPAPALAQTTPIPPLAAEASAPKRAVAPAPSASAAEESEISMLDRAHTALRSGRAAEALAITRQHARAYPRGALSQEREVIAVEALMASGRRAEAESRGTAFIRRFPNSSYARRLRTVLGIPGDGGS
jgi:hypothetical protein